MRALTVQLLFLAALNNAPALAVESPLVLECLAKSGEPETRTPEVAWLRAFGTPSLSENGRCAFRAFARLANESPTHSMGYICVYRTGSDGKRELLGWPHKWPMSMQIDSFHPYDIVAINDRGTVALCADAETPAPSVSRKLLRSFPRNAMYMSDNDGVLKTIIQEGDAAPKYPDSWYVADLPMRCSISPEGRMAFSAEVVIDPTDKAAGERLTYAHYEALPNGNVDLLADPKTKVPDAPNRVFSQIIDVAPMQNDSWGISAVTSAAEGSAGGVASGYWLRGSDGTFKTVVLSTDPLDDSLKGKDVYLSTPTRGASGGYFGLLVEELANADRESKGRPKKIFRSMLWSTRRGLVLEADKITNEVLGVAQESTLTSARIEDIDANGRCVIMSKYANAIGDVDEEGGNNLVISFVESAKDVRRILRSGDAAPGAPEGMVFGPLASVFMNDEGRVLVSCRLWPKSGTDRRNRHGGEGLWYWSIANGLQPLAVPGSPFLGGSPSGKTVESWSANMGQDTRCMNNLNQVAFVVRFTDKTSAVIRVNEKGSTEK